MAEKASRSVISKGRPGMSSVEINEVCFKEGDTYHIDQWCSILGVSSDEFYDLSSGGIFKMASRATERYRLSLVGFIFTKDKSFFSFPKIIKGNPTWTLCQEVLVCLRIYLSGVDKGNRHSSVSEVLSFSNEGGVLINTLLALIDWTESHGFHRNELDFRFESIEDIDWNATLAEELPVPVGKSSTYPSYVSVRSISSTGCLARMQAEALLILHEMMQPFSSFLLSTYDELIEDAKVIIRSDEEDGDVLTIDDLADYDAVCHRDHEKKLIAILYSFLSNDLKSAIAPRVFGTTSFEYVWEDMCRCLCNSFGQEVFHRDVASQPIWKFDDSARRCVPQRPDILRRFGGVLFLLDAKWYDSDNGELPGTADIIKQVMYKETLQSQEIRCFNAFMLPTAGVSDKPRKIAEAKMTYGGENDKRFSNIPAFEVSWHLALSAYRRSDGGGSFINALLEAVDA